MNEEEITLTTKEENKQSKGKTFIIAMNIISENNENFKAGQIFQLSTNDKDDIYYNALPINTPISVFEKGKDYHNRNFIEVNSWKEALEKSKRYKD